MSAAAEVRTRPVSQRRTFVATGIGNALEWYDWGIYASYAKFIASHHFNPDDPTSAVLNTLAVFAVGFVARPFGGLLLGWVADRRGRKFALMLSVLVASFGGLLIAVTPGYATLGVGASVILVVARLLQGLAHGGELPAAQTYLTEQAPRERRGLWSSWIYVSGTVGNMAGLAVGAGLALFLSDAQLDGFGWRIPFLLGAVLGVYALYLRRGLDESSVFTADVVRGAGPGRADHGPGRDLGRDLGRDQDAGRGRTGGPGAAPAPSMAREIRRHWVRALQVIGMTAGGTVIYYTWAINAPSYAQTTLKIDSGAALAAGLVGNLVFLVFLPLWGRLSDRIGRKPCLAIALFGSAALALPMNALLRDSAWQLALTMSIMLAVVAAFSSVGPAVFAEMFPTRIRAAGFGLPYSIAIALFGGTAPYLQAYLAGRYHSTTVFPVYAVVLLVISGLVILTLPETRGIDLHEESAPDRSQAVAGA